MEAKAKAIPDKHITVSVNLDRTFGASKADWERIKRMYTSGWVELPPNRRERFIRWAARLLGVAVEIPPRRRWTGGFI